MHGQARQDQVEGILRERQVGHVPIDEPDPVGHAKAVRVGQALRTARPGLIARAPQIDTRRGAGGSSLCCAEQHQASPTSEVQNVLVAAQAQTVQQSLADTDLADRAELISPAIPNPSTKAHAPQPTSTGEPAPVTVTLSSAAPTTPSAVKP